MITLIKEMKQREIKFRMWWKNQMTHLSSLEEMVFEDEHYFEYSGYNRHNFF